MTALSARRYAPNNSAALEAPILAAMADGAWLNVAGVCARIRRSSDDGAARYCLRRLFETSVIERRASTGIRGTVYHYRRKL